MIFIAHKEQLKKKISKTALLQNRNDTCVCV